MHGDEGEGDEGGGDPDEPVGLERGERLALILSPHLVIGLGLGLGFGFGLGLGLGLGHSLTVRYFRRTCAMPWPRTQASTE